MNTDKIETQFGKSAAADFEENTWTFEMPEDFKVVAGEFAIVEKSVYKNLIASPQPPFSHSDCEKKLLLIFRDDVLPHRIKQLVDLCENIYNSKK